ncbi:hypothetical protein VTO42DRAFT_2202 [Malbranchea cinnamomea]
MALSSRIDALIDDLISLVGKTPDKDTPQFQNRKRFVENTFQQNAALRSNPFDVRRRLDGLQEKFQIVGNDALADALWARQHELDTQRYQWAPDVLALLLELSDKPATNSKVGAMNHASGQPVQKEHILAWSDLEESDTFAGQADIWKDIDYSAETSDDSASLASSDVSIPRIDPQASKVPLESYIVPDDLFISVEDPSLVSSVQNAQAFREVPQDPRARTTLTELQAVREILFMLKSLPTSLFSLLDDKIEVNHRFMLNHISDQTFIALLESFCAIGTRIHRLRVFITQAQHVPLMQMFQGEIEQYLWKFDRFLSDVQQEHQKTMENLSISILQLLDQVRYKTTFLNDIAEIVDELTAQETVDPFLCLELLYDLVCLKQATGQHREFKLAVSMFSKCFEVYLKPIRLWMERGELDPALGAYFVKSAETGKDLRNLWHDWFVLKDSSGFLHAPKFLHSASRKIFTTGKSMIFLRHLRAIPDSQPSATTITALNYNNICAEGHPESLLPFSGMLEDAFNRLVDKIHSAASTLLRKQLNERCGLGISLQALEYIYLGRDLSRLDPVDRKILGLIDQKSTSWNDRFLLTELVQEAFTGLLCVDTSRLVVRSRKIPYDEFVRQSRSSQIVDALSIDYILPWPVANIITKEALASYQRISTFLMKIRRPKYILQRLWIVQSRSSTIRENEQAAAGTLAFCISHRLMWFLNTLYSHLTECVISGLTTTMLKQLQGAVDIDAMIDVHRAYVSSLEDECLLSKRLSAIHGIVISILDLCISFSDILASCNASHQFDRTSQSFNLSSGPEHAISRIHPQSALTEDYSSEEEDENGGAEENNVSSISFNESACKRRLIDVKVKFDRLVAIVAAGLRGKCRNAGVQSLELLADKLDWKREGVIHV